MTNSLKSFLLSVMVLGLVPGSVLTSSGQSSVPCFGFLEAGKGFADKAGALNTEVALFKLDLVALQTHLLTADAEFSGSPGLSLDVPMPDGGLANFQVWETGVMAPEVAVANPQLKTYVGLASDGSRAQLRMTVSGNSVEASVNSTTSGMTYLSRDGQVGDVYLSQRPDASASAPFGKTGSGCSVTDHDFELEEPLVPASTPQNTGSTLRTFRLGLHATGEFTQLNGGTPASAFAAMVGYVNRLNGLYERELAIRFVLVTDATYAFANAGTDPFNNSNAERMLTQNQTRLVQQLGSGGFDIGHLFGAHEAGDGPSGVAEIESLCVAATKGEGVTQIGDPTMYSQLFQDQVFFHEIGHQLGMTHSYNSNLGICDTREQATAVEPGAGATIMSYGFICYDDDDPRINDDYFQSNRVGLINALHGVSYAQAVRYLAKVSCGTSVATGNSAPVVTAPRSYTIPKSTPFFLQGSATDADAADAGALTYSWEGTNVGSVAAPTLATLTDTRQAPFFRTYASSPDPIRYYPTLSAILDGTNTARGDKLPSVGIVTTHRLTVRDNRNGAGGVGFAEASVTIDGNTGPFLVANDPRGSYSGNATLLVEWTPNGTTAATPLVNLLLSEDGGQTFPTVLVANTPNDGRELVALPNRATTAARIKVESVGNIFFDISNQDFTITQLSAVGDVAIRTLHASPNPSADGLVVIELDSDAARQIVAARLHNSIGQVVTPALNFDNARASLTLPAPGVYYLQLQFLDGSTAALPLIRQ